jgi:hypothetical protein
MDLQFSTALPNNIEYERLLSYFACNQHDIIHNILQQMTELVKSTIPDVETQDRINSLLQTSIHLKSLRFGSDNVSS